MAMKPYALNHLLDKIRRLPGSEREGPDPEAYSFAIPGRIRTFRWRPGLDFPKCDERFILILNLIGHGTASVEDTLFSLAPEHALLIFPYQRRDLSGLARKAVACIMFETANHASLAALRDTPVSLSPRSLMLAGQICDLYPIRSEAGSLDSSRLTMFVAFLLMELVTDARLAAETGVRRRSIAATPAPNDLYRKIEHYVTWCMNAPIPIRDLAREVGVSASHLRALFREQVGVSIGRFIRRRKVQHAAHLLETTGLAMKEITRKCGLGSIYNFSRCFRREMKMTPSGYRRQKLRRKRP